MDPTQIIEALRGLLLAGLGLSALLAFVVMRDDADQEMFKRYLKEHPGLQSDFDVWRRRRRRQLSVAAGRCPDHDSPLDTSGYCARCRRRPDD